MDLMQGSEGLTLESLTEERYQWVKRMLNKLDRLAGTDIKYEILSKCAHIFPKEVILRAKSVYDENKMKTGDAIQAIDATLAFMGKDHGWVRAPVRNGRIITNTKNPANLALFNQAKTREERRIAYCFCPLIRNHLEDNLSPTFCFCSAGWERQQWELILGKRVEVDVVESLLKGNDQCTFAVHIPEDL